MTTKYVGTHKSISMSEIYNAATDVQKKYRAFWTYFGKLYNFMEPTTFFTTMNISTIIEWAEQRPKEVIKFLVDHGFVKVVEKTYKVGDKFIYIDHGAETNSDYWIIAGTGAHDCCLINLKSGKQRTYPIFIKDPFHITSDEFERLTLEKVNKFIPVKVFIMVTDGEHKYTKSRATN